MVRRRVIDIAYIQLRLFPLALLLLLLPGAGRADNLLYSTTPNQLNKEDLPVDVTTFFTFTNGGLDITIRNDEDNPTAVNQALADMYFQVNGVDMQNVSITASAQDVVVNSNSVGGFTATTLPAPILDYSGGQNVGSYPWSASVGNSGGNTQVTLCANKNSNGCPAYGNSYLLLGQPLHVNTSGAAYQQANNSITGNGPHNPFAYYQINIQIAFTPLAKPPAGGWNNPGLIQTTGPNRMYYAFGTQSGDDAFAQFEMLQTPEPATIAGFLIGAGLLAVAARRTR